MDATITHKCTRCKRVRKEQFLFQKTYNGQKFWRCKGRSFCSSLQTRRLKKTGKWVKKPKAKR